MYNIDWKGAEENVRSFSHTGFEKGSNLSLNKVILPLPTDEIAK
jgi:hypothetical protein